MSLLKASLALVLVACCLSCGKGINNETPYIYLYATAPVGGDLNGRSGADALCAARKSDQVPSSSCRNIRAFISVTGLDEIVDMQEKYVVPANRAVLSGAGLKVADDWNDLLDGSIDRSLQDAQVLTGGNWWSGSDNAGFAVADTCTAWTATGTNGQVGNSTSTGTSWIATGAPPCFGTNSVLCVCW